MPRVALLLSTLLLPAVAGAQHPAPVADVAHVQAQAARLQLRSADLQQMAGELRAVTRDLSDLSSLAALAGLAAIAEAAPAMPEPWAAQDPADALYRQAREALNRSEYTRAIELFTQIRARHPRSSYTPDVYYWEAFALNRRGNTESMRQALDLLEQQGERHPGAATRGEARTLAIRIQGELARRGDEASAAAVASRVPGMVPPTPPTPPTAATPPVPPTPPSAGRGRVTVSSVRCEGEDDERVAALNALLQMDAERAIPVLERVLARRDAESACLRRKAIFLVSQKRSDRTETILLDAARSDPDAEVREQAIFWLAQTGSPRAASALDSILRTSSDPAIQKRAIFSLAQMNQASAGPLLRSYAGRSDVDRDVRDQAIFWLGQSGNAENAEFLQGLYRRERDEQVKERIIFAVSQMPRRNNATYGQWLAQIAGDASEPIKLRKNAIFWAGQSGAPLAELIQAYDRMPEAEMKEQVIFVLSQRRESEATDKLLDIARRDRDPRMREKAIFWLSQRNDPRISDLLLEILERRPGGE